MVTPPQHEADTVSEEMLNVYAAEAENRRYRDMAATEVLLRLGYRYELCGWVPPTKFVRGDRGVTRGGTPYVVLLESVDDGLMRVQIDDEGVYYYNPYGSFCGEGVTFPYDLMPPKRTA